MISIIWNIINVIGGLLLVIHVLLMIWHGTSLKIGKEHSKFYIEYTLNPLKDIFK